MNMTINAIYVSLMIVIALARLVVLANSILPIIKSTCRVD